MKRRRISVRGRIVQWLAAGTLLAMVAAPAAAQALAVGDVGPWQTASNPLPTAMFVGNTVEYNGFVYNVAGTTNSGDTAAVYYAPLNANGSVGTWQTSTHAFPVTVHRASIAAYNGYMYVLDGLSGASLLNTVYYTKINSDGSIGAWQSTTAVPDAMDAASAVAYNGYIYMIGGGDSGGDVNTAYYAPLNANGTVGTWSTTSTLPAVMRRAEATINNGYVYLVGGLNGSGNPSNTVFYAKFNANGTLGSWQTSTNALPTAVFDSTSVIDDGYIYNAGGNGPSGNVNNVYYAKLNSDNSVGPWQTASNALPDYMDGAQAVVYNHYFYNIAGSSTSNGLLSAIYYARLTQPVVATAKTSTTTASSSTPSSPDTGYGEPSAFIMAWAVAGLAVVVTAAGLLLCGRRSIHPER